jgi:ABC-type multidrug transport system fused ATPase/permease subunit
MNYQQFADQEVFKKGFRTIENHKSRKKKKGPQNKSMIIGSYARLLKYGFRRPLHFLGSLFFALTSQLGGILLPFLSGKVMNAIAKKDFDELQEYCLWYLGGLLVSSLSIFFRTSLIITISDLVSNMLKNDAFEK